MGICLKACIRADKLECPDLQTIEDNSSINSARWSRSSFAYPPCNSMVLICLLREAICSAIVLIVDTDDLISIGTIGLIKGIDTYKNNKKTKITTYAARCIQNEIVTSRK